MLQYHFNWKVLSASAGITWWNFYFRLYPTTIRAPQVVDFLGHLLRHLPGKLLVVWDGLPAHRARPAPARAVVATMRRLLLMLNAIIKTKTPWRPPCPA